jgi:hypothetical protein
MIGSAAGIVLHRSSKPARWGSFTFINITVGCQFHVIKLTFVSSVDLISVHAAEK